ncbi:MAG: 50S ribosomal protein L11 methyltransferase [Oscillospiraceae bacterium]|jgi:ribosomal protein L11 methyltransferase|nr:50S ribosomal protein L11 methyltransferase [Oscillospiraceae bacterium]
MRDDDTVDWMEVTVSTTTEGADIVAQLLCDAGAAGAAIQDRQDVLNMRQSDGMWDLLDERILAGMGEDVRVIAYFPADAQAPETLALLQEKLVTLALADIGLPLGSLAVSRAAVREEDWAENWKRHYKPFRVGERLVVKPSWEAYAPQKGDLILQMDPGMAFGTGTHETTWMCMEMLERHVTPGCACIDVGTGTGILAIAAALLGAGDVLAIDIDPDAIKVARENIARNGVADRVRAVTGDLLAETGAVAQVVVANIIADVIIRLAGPARRRIVPGGVLLCSGIIRDREADVRRALIQAGYAVDGELRRGEWVCLAARTQAR